MGGLTNGGGTTTKGTTTSTTTKNIKSNPVKWKTKSGQVVTMYEDKDLGETTTGNTKQDSTQNLSIWDLIEKGTSAFKDLTSL